MREGAEGRMQLRVKGDRTQHEVYISDCEKDRIMAAYIG
jgi:hypothetical protein